jgi:CheY-like chemotaxis protein
MEGGNQKPGAGWIVFWVATTIVPCLDEAGCPKQYISIKTDITERRAAEVELSNARDAAQAADRSKSQFLANMSHEIRTPMNGVTGMTGLLEETPLNAAHRDYLNTTRQSGDLLMTVIHDILDFSNIEAGRLTFEVVDFNLQEVVEDTLDMLAEAARDRRLEFLGLIGPEVVPWLRGDAGRLRQVLTNLPNSAIKFTEKGEVVLEVSQFPEGMLRFEVRDTGIGISPADQKAIFQPFRQADGPNSRKFGGTGLGLAISRQLIHLMGGGIGLESMPGKGSTFWVTARFQRQAIPGRLPEQKELAWLRVLIVDDTSINQLILQMQCSTLRMLPVAVSGGQEALARMQLAVSEQQPFDVALLDMQMPEMDGRMLAAAVKASPALRGTRLVIVSSSGPEAPEERGNGSDIDWYLVRPVRQSKLFETQKVAMGHQSSVRALEEKSAGGELGPRPAVRIFLAGYNIINQKVALRMLAKLGYHADPVADGNEVLEALQRIPYDIILMDCRMPELDGYETSRRIRQIHQRGILIIALTAHAMEGDREKCLESGMDDYVTKPMCAAALGEALQRWKDKAREA